MKNQIEILGSKGQVIAIMRVKVLKGVFAPAPAVKPAKAAKTDKIVLHTDVRTRWEAGKELEHCYNAEINLTQKTIRVYGHGRGYEDRNVVNRHGKMCNYPIAVAVPFDRTFVIGQTVEYDSYNFAYTDPIVAITEKGVKISHGSHNSIMKIAEFINKNWNLCLEKIAERRREWYD